jgi:hypothetical protein
MSPSKEEWRAKEAAIRPAVDRDFTLGEGIMREVLPFTKPLFTREAPNRAPVQIATAVIVTIAHKVFLLTAAHAMEHFKRKSLFLPLDGEYVQTEARLYWNDPGPSGRHNDHDRVDTAILHVGGSHEQRLAEIAYPLERSLLLNHAVPTSYVIVGFPLTQAKRSGHQIFSYPMPWIVQGKPQDVYQKFQLNPSRNLVFGFPKRIVTKDGYALRPALPGMSGGGVWIAPRLDGIDLSHRLVGIFTGTEKARSLALATNVRLHVDCISRFFPNLFSIDKAPTTSPRIGPSAP